MKQLFLLLFLLLPFTASAQKSEGIGLLSPVSQGFSVYLQRSQSNDVIPVKDIHYNYGDKKSIPLTIQPGRQSILYPLKKQGSLSLYRLTRDGRQEKKEILVTTPVPAGASRGVLILIPTSTGLKCQPFWVTPKDRKGLAKIQNLTKTTVGLRINKSKKLISLKPSKSTTVQGTFKQNESHAVLDTAIYQFRPKKKRKMQKLSELVFHVHRKQSAFIFILPNKKLSAKALTLIDDGQINYGSQRALLKYLPTLAKK